MIQFCVNVLNLIKLNFVHIFDRDLNTDVRLVPLFIEEFLSRWIAVEKSNGTKNSRHKKLELLKVHRSFQQLLVYLSAICKSLSVTSETIVKDFVKTTYVHN